MRPRNNAILAIAFMTVLVSPAHAGSLLNETFSYPDGNLAVAPNVTGGAWIKHSGIAGADIRALGGMAAGSMTEDYDDHRSLASPRGTTDVTYACFSVRIPTPTAPLVTNYFARLMVNSTIHRSKVFVTPAGATFTFGLSVTANQSGSPLAVPAPPLGATWPAALTYDQWYRVVISYDAAGGVSRLWVDPESEASPGIVATDALAAGGALTAFGLRQSNTAGAAFAWNVDDLSVGTSFADACDTATPSDRTTWGRIKAIYR
jgi:hypothetical protein